MIHKLAIYPVTLFIYKGLDHKQYKKQVLKDSNGLASQKFIDATSTDDFRAIVHSYHGNVVIRFIEKKPSVGLVAHEALHATCRIMDYVGVKMCEDSEEAWAYLLQEIINEINYEKPKPKTKTSNSSTRRPRRR